MSRRRAGSRRRWPSRQCYPRRTILTSPLGRSFARRADAALRAGGPRNRRPAWWRRQLRRNTYTAAHWLAEGVEQVCAVAGVVAEHFERLAEHAVGARLCRVAAGIKHLEHAALDVEDRWPDAEADARNPPRRDGSATPADTPTRPPKRNSFDFVVASQVHPDLVADLGSTLDTAWQAIDIMVDKLPVTVRACGCPRPHGRLRRAARRGRMRDRRRCCSRSCCSPATRACVGEIRGLRGTRSTSSGACWADHDTQARQDPHDPAHAAPALRVLERARVPS